MLTEVSILNINTICYVYVKITITLMSNRKKNINVVKSYYV